jgi:hypothetical protein
MMCRSKEEKYCILHYAVLTFRRLQLLVVVSHPGLAKNVPCLTGEIHRRHCEEVFVWVRNRDTLGKVKVARI